MFSPIVFLVVFHHNFFNEAMMERWQSTNKVIENYLINQRGDGEMMTINQRGDGELSNQPTKWWRTIQSTNKVMERWWQSTNKMMERYNHNQQGNGILILTYVIAFLSIICLANQYGSLNHYIWLIIVISAQTTFGNTAEALHFRCCCTLCFSNTKDIQPEVYRVTCCSFRSIFKFLFLWHINCYLYLARNTLVWPWIFLNYNFLKIISSLFNT